MIMMVMMIMMILSMIITILLIILVYFVYSARKPDYHFKGLGVGVQGWGSERQ